MASVAGVVLCLGFVVGVPMASETLQPAPGTTSIEAGPLDAFGCTGTLGSDQIENCVTVFGSASYLEEVDGTAFTHFGSVTGHEEITGPSIPDGHLNSPTETINTTNNGPLISWDPDSSVEPGNYCAIFWQKVSGGYSENGPACEYVS
jgi:hypothetical protein